jgi:hypothetical protein
VTAVAVASLCAEPLVRDASAAGVIDPRRRRHRMVVLPPPVGCSGRAVLLPLALNECGEVTGQVLVDPGASGCLMRPFIWSMCGRFDLGEQIAWNLAELASEPLWVGAGFGVNDDGVVAGTLGASAGEGRPWLWDLATFVTPSGPLGPGGSVPLGPGDSGEARAVNNDSPAIVAGWTKSGSAVERGFRYRVGDAPSSIMQLPLFASDPGHLALAVPTTESDPERLFGGSLGGAIGGFPPCVNGIHDEAIVWTVGTSTTVEALIEDSTDPSSLAFWQGRALAANAQGQAAGWRRQPEQSLDCTQRAVFWEADGTPIEVGLVSPIPSDRETEVRGMTGADGDGNGVLLVGADVTGQQGIFWWRSPSSGELITEFIGQSPWPLDFDVIGGATVVAVYELTAVNTRGWILGAGEFGTSPLDRGFLLIPDPCSPDLDLDGQIDGADLGLLLAAWGACGSAGYCAGDLSFDGEIDGADLGLLLAAWGECDVFEAICASTPCSQSPSVAQALAEAPSPEDEGLLALLLSAGFPSSEAFLSWADSASEAQIQAMGAMILGLSDDQSGGDQ